MGSNDTSRLDMKKYRRNEEEAKLKRQSLIRGVSLLAIAAVCVGVLGGRQVNKYLDKNGTWLSIGEHKIKKPEFEYYYQNSINSFMNTYGSYASYFGLDTSKPLDQQSYTGNMTWKDYFEQQAADTLQQVYALSDTAKAEGFEYDAEKEVKKTLSQIKDAAKANEQDPDEYIKSLYGEDATQDRIREYMLLSEYASHYYEKVDKDTSVTEDEIKQRYEENKADYDSVDYMLCEIAADIPEETAAQETVSEEAETDGEAILVDENETGDEEIVLEEAETGDGEIVVEGESVTEADETQADESASETESETMSESEREELEKKKEEEKAKAMAEAKNKADAMLSAVSDADQFEALYAQYASQTASAAKHSGERSASVSNSQVEEWLFDDARQAGEKTVIEDTDASAYYVVMFLNRFRDETKTVDFRHILIKPEEVKAETAETAETTETVEAAQEESTAAEAETETAETETVSESEAAAESEAQAKAADEAAAVKADKIFSEWKSGKATEKSFGKLAKKNSEDTGSTSNGGLYEKTSKGSMVSEVDSWLFDPARKPGDTDIVHSVYGYHIMYYVGDNQPEWHNEAEDFLHDEKMETYMDDLEEKFPIKEGRKKLAYLHIPETETGTESETGSETDSAETEGSTDTAASETAQEASEETK